MSFEKKMKKRGNEKLNQIVNNPYASKETNVKFPLWGKIVIPLAASFVVAIAIGFPVALSMNRNYGSAPLNNGESGAADPSPIDPSSDGSTLEQLGASLLRSPENLSHAYSYYDTIEANYLSFKDSINNFSNKLSVSVLNSFFDENKNIAISPLSIEMCLFLATSISNGVTRAELETALGVDYSDISQYQKLFYNDLTYLYKTEANEIKGELSLTNSIWIDDDVSLLSTGLDELNNNLYCYSYNVDFNNNNQNANEAIRQFNKEKTKGLIDQNLMIDSRTLFVLMNTLYLKDIWNELGDELSLADPSYTFKNLNGTTSSQRLLSGNYVSGKTLFQEDYSSFYTCTENGLKLHFIKPNNGKNLQDVLTEENISFVLNKDNYEYVNDTLKEAYYTRTIFPEFKAEFNDDLKPILANDFGVQTLFTDSADLTNITTQKAFCDGVNHVAKLDVNKKGIEGAAVTYMAYPGASELPDYDRVNYDFVIDKEFAFILTNYSNNVVFSGLVTNID